MTGAVAGQVLQLMLDHACRGLWVCRKRKENRNLKVAHKPHMLELILS